MTTQERREQLLKWMRLRPPYHTRALFLHTPLSLYRNYWDLSKDLGALRGEGRVRLTPGRRWKLASGGKAA